MRTTAATVASPFTTTALLKTACVTLMRLLRWMSECVCFPALGAVCVCVCVCLLPYVSCSHPSRPHPQLAPPSPTCNSADGNLYFNRGNTLLALGEHDSAMVDMRRAIELRPGVAKFTHGLGLALERAAQYDAALEQFQAASDADEDHLPSLFHVALMQHQMHRLRLAIQSYSRLLDRQTDRRVLEGRGLAHHERGDMSEALKDLTAAVELAPRAGDARFLRAQLLVEMGSFLTALEDLDVAQRSRYNVVAVLNVKAHALRCCGRHKQALRALRRALRLARRAEGLETESDRRRRLLKQKKRRDGKKQLRLAASGGAAFGRDGYFYGSEGKRAGSDVSSAKDEEAGSDSDSDSGSDSEDGEEDGKKDDAFGGVYGSEEAKTAAATGDESDLEPFCLPRADAEAQVKSTALLEHRAQVYMELKRWADAEADLTLAMASAELPSLLSARGRCRYELGLYELAEEDLQAAADAKTGKDERPSMLYFQALACARRDMHARAVELLSEVIEMEACDGLGYHYVALHERAKEAQLAGDYAAAIEDFDAVLERTPGNVHALFRRGFAHKSMGRLDLAAEDFEAARRLAPHNPALLVNYRTLHRTEVILLCPPGEEPDWLTMAA
eukprot:PLAT9143.2.p1 GENE.PLAT9143.2~~PLAT9143.2.p1  ORF type:complete len:616 (-),score=150.69 PLAT9143.2:1277-3124(-)